MRAIPNENGHLLQQAAPEQVALPRHRSVYPQQHDLLNYERDSGSLSPAIPASAFACARPPASSLAISEQPTKARA
jgi:hypothetical protein